MMKPAAELATVAAGMALELGAQRFLVKSMRAGVGKHTPATGCCSAVCSYDLFCGDRLIGSTRNSSSSSSISSSSPRAFRLGADPSLGPLEEALRCMREGE